MTKLEAYESALTFYGTIFSRLRGKNERYFLGTIKRDFVFFLFALIWKGTRPQSPSATALAGKAGGASEFKSKSRLIPRNFNEWTFGEKTILLNAPAIEGSRESIWNIDRAYFHSSGPVPKTAEGIAVLGCGIDFEKSFDLAGLARERKILAAPKKSRARDTKSLPFFLQNLAALFFIYRALGNNCILHCSLAGFLRYFVYYAFASARIRAIIKDVAKNRNIGKVMSSDLDNVIGNSMILWSHLYGLSQICYPHGSPVFLNKNRYFEPEEYYVWTTYQKIYAEETKNSQTKFTPFPPKWLQNFSIKQGEGVRKITIVTAMEENLEIPFQDREVLINYIEKICEFALKKNTLVNIKSHKLLDWHLEYDKLCARYKNLTHVKKRWSIGEIEETDIGVLMNTSSTLGLQLLYLGIPVITCGETMSEIVPKHFSAPYLGFISKNKTELLQILEQLTSDKGFYKQTQAQALETFRSILVV